MISYGEGESILAVADSNLKLMEEYIKIAERLQNGSPDISELSNAVTKNNITLELLISEIKSSLDRGNPEAAIDRLHTFITNFIREICEKNAITSSKDKLLHSLLGEYIKELKKRGKLESSMSERILKSNISILEAFNDVRNNQSLAHDNKPLNKAESRFIFNSVVSAIKFLREIENIN